MSLESSITSKLVTSKVMVSVKAASLLKRGQSKKTDLIQVGGKQIPAVCGMMRDVVIKHPHVHSDTFESFAEDHTTMDPVLLRREPLTSNHDSDAYCAYGCQRDLILLKLTKVSGY